MINFVTMSAFRNFSNVLRGCEKTAKKILEQSLKTMGELESDDCEAVDDILDALALEDYSTTRSKVLAALQNESLKWVTDSEKVLAEIPYFVLDDEGSGSKFSVNADPEKCPFLSEVWNGDTYDIPEIGGLNALADDLKTQLSAVSIRDLVKKIIATGI